MGVTHLDVDEDVLAEAGELEPTRRAWEARKAAQHGEGAE